MHKRLAVRVVALALAIVPVITSCTPDPPADDDRTGDIGQEQGDLDRDVEDFDDDPRQGPENPPRPSG